MIKISAPGWEIQFDSFDDALDELDKHICSACIDDHYEQYGFTPLSIHDLLGTACGCEFDIDVP